MAARLTTRELGFLLGGIGAGAPLGFGGAYYLLKNKLMKEYSDLAEQEISEMREHFQEKEAERKRYFVTSEEHRELDEAAQEVVELTSSEKPKLEDLIETLKYSPKDPREKPPVTAYHKIADKPSIEKNVFEERDPTEDVWDYKTELDKRVEVGTQQPYIIHKDEFDEMETQGEVHEQVTLTYFSGDDVLCDERDVPVDNRDAMVGDENLAGFGHGSGDMNVVYIRNEPLGTDFEICRSDGNFSQEVHGFPPNELEHSAMRRRVPRGYSDD